LCDFCQALYEQHVTDWRSHHAGTLHSLSPTSPTCLRWDNISTNQRGLLKFCTKSYWMALDLSGNFQTSDDLDFIAM